ncbi:hypothetical protein MUO98_05750, partial [Candidatus Bathyarchaeota archaeon]|nr:hypothetical protein [Candidatus Bathyarchaeota archaeon]
KPKPEEIQIVSIDKFFEPYVVVDGEYSIDYSKNWSHNIQVDETMQDLAFCGEKITPVSLKDHLATPCKIVTLAGVGRFKCEAKARLIFDCQWREVGLEQLPFVPFEEQPEKILDTVDPNPESASVSEEKEVEILKSRLVQRPSDILSIHKELFSVFDRALIYKPMYKVTVKNIKTKKEATIVIDAITGKTKVGLKQAAAPTEKEPVKKPEKSIASEETAMGNLFNLANQQE